MLTPGNYSEIIIKTRNNPDHMDILDFKNTINKYLKKGYLPIGELLIKKDGAMWQEMKKKR